MAITIPSDFNVITGGGSRYITQASAINDATMQDLIENAHYLYAVAFNRVLMERDYIVPVATTGTSFIIGMETTATLGTDMSGVLLEVYRGAKCEIKIDILKSDATDFSTPVTNTFSEPGSLGSSSATVTGITETDVIIRVSYRSTDGASAQLWGVRVIESSLAALPPFPYTFLGADFDSDTGSLDGTPVFPTDWDRGTGSWTVYGSTTDDGPGTNYGWLSGKSGTGSSGTGPTGGMLAGVDATAGTINTAAAYRYCYVETSGSSGSPNKRFLLRTPEINLSTAASNNTLKLTLWFHAYGVNIGTFGIAATTSASSASSAVEATSGSGFTSDSLGGLSMEYWNVDGGASSTTGVRITGTQQASNGEAYRKITVDLNDLAGASSVYFHIFYKSGSSFKGDLAIDSIKIEGET